MFSITCINHMPCLSTMTADFRSISSFITFSVSMNHCLGLTTKNWSLVLCTERTNHLLMGTNMVRWTKVLWGINNFNHDKCSNQSSQTYKLLKGLIFSRYEISNKNTLKIMYLYYIYIFQIHHLYTKHEIVSLTLHWICIRKLSNI